MVTSEHNSASISPPNCNKMLIFGKKELFIILFQNTSVRPINILINLVFVMSSLLKDSIK